jgi:hypothetical protein
MLKPLPHIFHAFSSSGQGLDCHAQLSFGSCTTLRTAKVTVPKIRVDLIGLLPDTHPLECRSFKNQPRVMGLFCQPPMSMDRLIPMAQYFGVEGIRH